MGGHQSITKHRLTGNPICDNDSSGLMTVFMERNKTKGCTFCVVMCGFILQVSKNVQMSKKKMHKNH